MNRTAKGTFAGVLLLAVVLVVVGLGGPGVSPVGAADSQQVLPKHEGEYEAFNDYCLRYFGAEKEQLAYVKFGAELRLREDGSWRHVSENSACIGWETNLPSRGYIEYGETVEYGKKTQADERFFFLHVHHLSALEAGQTYHHRIVSTDERGNVLRSDDATITPRPIPDAIHVPGDLGQPPYNLTESGATYVLTDDITAAANVINIRARNVTLDLNGHTITYDNVAGAKDPNVDEGAFGHFRVQGNHGIRGSYGARGSRVLNGRVVQGLGGGGGGYEPVYANGFAEVAGVTIDYYGTQLRGFAGSGGEIHHCVVLDRGTELTNRHQGVAGIADTGHVHHCQLKRVRQRGIGGGRQGTKIYRNEVYIDSCATNSFGIMYYKTRNAVAHGNRIFGTGYHALGIGTVSAGVGDIKIYDNYIHMRSREPDHRWDEYGAQSGVNGFRVTWGGDNIEWYDNVVVVEGREAGKGEVRGIWHVPQPDQKNLVYHDNIIKAVADEAKTSALGCVVISGSKDPEKDHAALFKNNVLISDFCNLSLGGGYYGAANNGRFVGNRFVKIGDKPSYRTIQCGSGGGTCVGFDLIASVFADGAGFDLIKWRGDGRRGFSVGYTLSITAKIGTEVVVKDKAGDDIFSDRIPASGAVEVSLVQYRHEPDGKIELTPHTVTVGRSTKMITADRPRAYQVTGGAWKELPVEPPNTPMF